MIPHGADLAPTIEPLELEDNKVILDTKNPTVEEEEDTDKKKKSKCGRGMRICCGLYCFCCCTILIVVIVIGAMTAIRVQKQ